MNEERRTRRKRTRIRRQKETSKKKVEFAQRFILEAKHKSVDPAGARAVFGRGVAVVLVRVWRGGVGAGGAGWGGDTVGVVMGVALVMLSDGW